MITVTSCTILFSAWWIGQRYSLTVAEQQFERADYFLHNYLESQAALLSTSVQGIVTDYGFRETVANGDPATIHSMVDNHARRVGLDFLLITDTDGQLLASQVPLAQDEFNTRLASLLETPSDPPKLAALAGQFYWLLSSEIRAPHPVGISIAGIALDLETLVHAQAITGLDLSLHSASKSYSLGTKLSSNQMTAADKGLLRQPSINRQLILNSLPDDDVSLSLTADLTAFHQQFDRFSLSLLIVSVVLVSIITLFSLLLSRRVFMPFESLHKTLLYRASHDDLTGLHNRVTINEQLGIKISEAQRNNSGFFVALLDIDHFKRINDNYGHSAGDTILREVATRLKQTLRDYDVVGRYGGEEFIVFATDDLTGCEARLLRLKQAISKDSFNSKHQDIKLTISIGACFVDFQQCEARVASATLIEVADQALYKAKSEGRNRVVIQSHDGELFARKILN